MIRFTVHKTYSCRSICDQNCVWHFKIVERTDKSVTTLIRGKKTRRKIRHWDGVETFHPFGLYSMSPTVSADAKDLSNERSLNHTVRL